LTTGTASGEPKLTTSTVSAAMTLYHFVSALLVIFVSDAMARLGPRLVAGIGATALALALYLISRVSSPTDLFVAYLVMSLAWAALTNAAIVNILGPWFTRAKSWRPPMLDSLL
jgi:hypothetical protein